MRNQPLLNLIQLLQLKHRNVEGITSAPSVNSIAWKSEAVITQDRYIRPLTPNGFIYRSLTGMGLTGVTEPTWPIIAASTVVDNEITWEAVDEDNAPLLGWPLSQISSAQFPLVLTAEGENGQWEKNAGQIVLNRSPVVSIFLHPAETQFYPIARNDALFYIERMGEFYSDPANRFLALSDDYYYVVNSEPSGSIQDDGISVMEYLSREYYGIQFTLNTTIRLDDY